MRKLLYAGLIFSSYLLQAQNIDLKSAKLVPYQVSMGLTKMEGATVLTVVKDSTVKGVDEPTFVRIDGIELQDGTIEVTVKGQRHSSAPIFARGFIGIAFRINSDNTKYESIYLRPANGRENDQFRRNHTVQYYSYPDYKFDRLRKESDGRYETYADIGIGEWIKMKIVIEGETARLFLNDSKYPSFVVNDLKMGKGVSGGIGLWVDVGTEGYFKDLRVTK